MDRSLTRFTPRLTNNVQCPVPPTAQADGSVGGTLDRTVLAPADGPGGDTAAPVTLAATCAVQGRDASRSVGSRTGTVWHFRETSARAIPEGSRLQRPLIYFRAIFGGEANWAHEEGKHSVSCIVLYCHVIYFGERKSEHDPGRLACNAFDDLPEKLDLREPADTKLGKNVSVISFQFRSKVWF